MGSMQAFVTLALDSQLSARSGLLGVKRDLSDRAYSAPLFSAKGK